MSLFFNSTSSNPSDPNSAQTLQPSLASSFSFNAPDSSNVTPSNSFAPNSTQNSLFGAAPNSAFGSQSVFAQNLVAPSASLGAGSNSGFGMFGSNSTTNNPGFVNNNSAGNSVFGGVNSFGNPGFGSAPSNTNVFGGGSSSFGSTSNTNQGFSSLSSSNSAPTTTGLFSNPSPTTTSSLFSNSAPSNSSNLFSTSTSTPTTSNITSGSAPQSLFGASQHKSPPPSSFPNPSTSTTGSLFSTQTLNPSAPTQFGCPTPMFGVPNPSPFFIGQTGAIPVFQEIPSQSIRRAFNISLAETNSETNLVLIVNQTDTYRVSLKTFVKTCGITEDLKDTSENCEIEIETPFSEAFFEAVFWIVYRCDEKLQNFVQSFKSLLEVYATFRLLKVKKELNVGAMLIGFAQKKGIFSNIQIFPAALNRKYVDLQFVVELIKSIYSGLFGGNFGVIKSAVALEWLGERDCESEKDARVLMETEEFRNMGKTLAGISALPRTMQDYAALSVRYPIAVQSITLQQVLQSFNLLST